MQASVRLTDAETMLSPQVMERIVDATIERWMQIQASAKQADKDRLIRDSALSDDEF